MEITGLPNLTVKHASPESAILAPPVRTLFGRRCMRRFIHLFRRHQPRVLAGTVGSADYIHKEGFSLPAFSGTLPENVNLTIRRNPADTYTNTVLLTGLRRSYQACR
jgi:hypothetical protein